MKIYKVFILISDISINDIVEQKTNLEISSEQQNEIQSQFK